MSFDPLAPYRRKPLVTEPTITGPKEPEGYIAVGGKDRVERLRIRRVMAPTRSPRYLHLQDMAYDGNFGTNFALMFEFMIVLVRGKNLQGVLTAIESGTADFIQQYDPDLWPKPADDAPFIESIEVIIPGDGGESEKQTDVKPH
jgi:hypothetical protein